MQTSVSFILTGIIFFSLNAEGQNSTRNDPSVSIKHIDHLLDSFTNLYRFNGTALVAKNGVVLLEKGYGWKDIKSKTKHDAGSIFQVGSVTKQFTSAIILKLQEEGKLSVTDLLSKYLPQYPNGNKITLYHLLTHTSGIYDYISSLSPVKFLFKKTRSKEKILDIFKNKPLAFEPGSAFAYSNSGYFLLGMVIEKITGKPYEKTIREIIFNPAGMQYSGFDFRGLNSSLKATGYSVFYDRKQSEAFNMDSTVLYAAGGMYSTVGDLHKWLESLLHQKILSANSWQQAIDPYKNNYALGWATGVAFNKKYITHGGLTPNFSSLLLHFMEDDVSVILFNNHSSNLWNTSMIVSQILFGEKNQWGSEPPVNIKPNELQLLTGSYSLDAGKIYSLSIKEGQLVLQGTRATGISDDVLVALSSNRFYSKRYFLEIRIERDADGQVKGLQSTREGFSFYWNKLP